MLHEKFEELKHTGDLPSPSGVGLRILLLTQEENCSLSAIVEAIQIDPALTGRILKLACSANFASSAPVTSAKEAAIRLGLRTVANVSLGFTLVDGNRSGRCERFDYDGYWSWSLANAVAAEVLSREFQIGNPAEAFTCALLSRIGRLALASVHASDYDSVLEQWASSGGSLEALERDRFRIDHRDVAAAMMEDWGLPAAFGEAARCMGREEHEETDDPQTYELLKILNASWIVADYCVAEEDEQHRHWERLRSIPERLQIDEDGLERVCGSIAASWHEWGRFLDVPTHDVQPIGVVRDRAKRAQPGSREAEVPDKLRILAVDDDAVSLRVLARHLERAGHMVRTATNGKQALALALEVNPQIVITDWMMPEMDGLAFCKALRKYGAGRNMYVLLLTGRGEEDRVVEAFEAGVDDYIVKPFKPRLLIARVRAGKRVVELQDQVDRDKRLQREQVAKLAVLNRKLRAAALTDPLTELPNRRYAMKRLDMEWASSTRSGQPLSLIMVDIDHFKTVNDRYGHDVGDVVLKQSAQVMQAMLRSSDTCARIGGEEFILICPNTDADGAFVLAERVRQELQENVVRTDGFEGRVTASLGVASRSVRVAGVDHFMKLADSAVYRAKELGRNRTCRPLDPPDEARTA